MATDIPQERLCVTFIVLEPTEMETKCSWAFEAFLKRPPLNVNATVEQRLAVKINMH